MDVKYCPVCRSELQPRMIDGKARHACSSSACRFVHWNNPIPVVAALVRHQGNYVLARNVGWPKDIFSLLTGFLEEGEAPESAVAREVREELGLHSERLDFLGHFPLPEFNQLLIAYALDARGTLILNHEIAEVKSVSPDELASFDFGPLLLTRNIVSCWLERCATQAPQLR